MNPAITIGDKTTHGGVVIEADQTFLVDGKPVHLGGMKHYCPQCKSTVSAIASNQLVVINGKAMIVSGDKTSCGAVFLSSQNLVVKDQGSGSSSSQPNNSNFVKSSSKKYGQKFLLQDSSTQEPLHCVKYEVYKNDQLITIGSTDHQGFTEFISANQNEELELRVIINEEHNGKFCCFKD